MLVFFVECLRIEGILLFIEVSRKKKKIVYIFFFCCIIGNGLYDKVLILYFMFLIELGVFSEILFFVK